MNFRKNTLKIGSVKFLNAKPLDYGFKYSNYIINQILNQYEYLFIEDIPSKLIQKLIQNDIDIGLVSSIEALRNEEKFDFFPELGVCAKKCVQSIFYIKKTNNFNEPVKQIFLDISSKSSVALLKILYYKTFHTFPSFTLETPENILKKIDMNSGGLLIGDPAIELLLNQNSFFVKDLAEWWYELTNLPFVFALWTYRKDLNFDKKIFLESYNIGMKHLNNIIKDYPFPESFSLNYLKKILYYKIQKEEIQSLNLYKQYLMDLDLF